MVLVTGPTGSGKTTTLYSALSELNKHHRQHLDGRRPGRIQPRRHQPGADPRRHRPQLRRRAALLPAPGPRRHHGRRGPRFRNRRDRHQGRAHRPPGALDASHQRRPLHDQPPAQHGRRAVPRRVVAEFDPRAATGAGHLPALQDGDASIPARRCSRSASRPEETRATCNSSTVPAATSAAGRASGAASRSTKCCRCAKRSAKRCSSAHPRSEIKRKAVSLRHEDPSGERASARSREGCHDDRGSRPGHHFGLERGASMYTSGRTRAEEFDAMADIQEFLKIMIEKGASDLHVAVNSPPLVRVNGDLRPLAVSSADADRHQESLLQPAHRGAEASLRGRPRARFLLRAFAVSPLPRQLFLQKGSVGGRLPRRSLQDPELPGARPAPGRERAVQAAARARARHRTDRQRQVHHPRVDGRQGQPGATRARRHGRGPDRVRARAASAAWSTSARCSRTPRASTMRCDTCCARIRTSC